MQALDKLREKLAAHPQITVRDEGREITVLAICKDGFDVAFSADDTGFTVCLGPWHEHFEPADEQSALEYFAFGLSGEARLRVKSKGGEDYSWTLEALEDGEWRSYSTTALFFFPYWRRRRVRYLQNVALTQVTSGA